MQNPVKSAGRWVGPDILLRMGLSEDDELRSCVYPALNPPIDVPLTITSPHPCPYLAGREARMRAFATDELPGILYHEFLDAGFRRSGQIIYQPVCRGCRDCIPLRLEVERFRPSKSQRRCWRRNQDLSVTVARPTPTDEKFELYLRYQAQRHPRPTEDSRSTFEEFLYHSPVNTLEFVYRDADANLLAIGICDTCQRSLSSVYFFFETGQSRRGLGTLGVLKEIELAKSRGIGHYYLGYWVPGCDKMEYKADFGPHEVLGPDGRWRPGGKQRRETS